MRHDIRALIEERQSQHGDFRDTATHAQLLKYALRYDPKQWDRLAPWQREALETMATKIGRILSGDNNFDDHWRDIAGYATLILDSLGPRKPIT